MLNERTRQPTIFGGLTCPSPRQDLTLQADQVGRRAYLGRWLNCCRAGSPAGARCTGSHRGRTHRSGSAPADPAHTSGNTRSTGTTPQPPGRLQERDSVGGGGASPKHSVSWDSSYPDPKQQAFHGATQPCPQAYMAETRLNSRTQTQMGTRRAHMPADTTQPGPRRRGREAGPVTCLRHV